MKTEPNKKSWMKKSLTQIVTVASEIGIKGGIAIGLVALVGLGGAKCYYNSGRNKKCFS